MLGLIILLIAILAGWFAFCILEKLPRKRMLPPLYVVVSQENPNIEWLIRCLCRRAKIWRLVVICHPQGEERAIIQRLAEEYGFDLAPALPPGALFKLNLDKKSQPAQIKKELRFLAAKAKREEKPLPRRI